jgi:hypothetical protein
MKRLGTLFLAVTLMVELLARSAVPVAACTIPDPGPIEKQVAESPLIYMATITGDFTVPPLDESVPDDDYHVLHLTVVVDEYLKGVGPLDYTFNTGTQLVFNEAGEVVHQWNSCSPWEHPSAGTRFIVLAGADGVPRPIIGAADLSTPYGQLLAEVVAVLNATPTPVPAPTAQPTSAPPTPRALPESGGALAGDGYSAPEAFAASASLALAACAAWQWRRSRWVGGDRR